MKFLLIQIVPAPVREFRYTRVNVSHRSRTQAVNEQKNPLQSHLHEPGTGL